MLKVSVYSCLAGANMQDALRFYIFYAINYMILDVLHKKQKYKEHIPMHA